MAVAIQTRYIGPTNHRGARVVAELMESHDGKRERVTVGWDVALIPYDNHARACLRLLQRLAAVAGRTGSCWSDSADWIGGGTDKGYVWVHRGYPAACDRLG